MKVELKVKLSTKEDYQLRVVSSAGAVELRGRGGERGRVGPRVKVLPIPRPVSGWFKAGFCYLGVGFDVWEISSRRVFRMTTQAQRKLLHTWIILVIVKQHLVQIS